MPFGLWRKEYTIRRYGPPAVVNGHLIPGGYEDIMLGLDVQISKSETITDADGEHKLQKLEVFADDEIYMVDEAEQRPADLLWFQGKWYECRSVILLDNTILSHYECEFIQCLHQEKTPHGEVPHDNK